jgi:hypothetical protein
MTRDQASRLGFALLAAGWAAALTVLAASVWRGEWTAYGQLLWQIPEILKHPGRRSAFLMPWLFPMGVAYVLTLSSGIFWGLRRWEKLRR